MNIRLKQAWALGTLLGLVSIADASGATLAYSKADRVNVRSRPGYVGEIITQLTRGEELRIVGTNVISKPAPDEPPIWYKIELSETSPLWVSAEYIDADTKTVKADVLNVRAGPSLDHASVARVKRGTPLRPLGEVRGEWLQVGAPAGAFGFVPAAWVTFDAAGAAAPIQPPTSNTNTNTNTKTNTPAPATAPPAGGAAVIRTAPPAPVVATASAPVAAPAAKPQTISTPPAAQPAPLAAATHAAPPVSAPTANLDSKPPVAAAPPAPVVTTVAAAIPAAATIDDPTPLVSAVAEEEGAKAAAEVEETQGRRVRREGVVIRPSNVKAPTHFALKARDSGKTINFLFTSRSLPINWRDHWGKVVWITGREYLDQRHLWRGIPLLDVEDIEAVR